jgi:hypothetical protein
MCMIMSIPFKQKTLRTRTTHLHLSCIKVTYLNAWTVLPEYNAFKDVRNHLQGAELKFSPNKVMIQYVLGISLIFNANEQNLR